MRLLLTDGTDRIWRELRAGLRGFIAKRVPASDVDDVLQDVFVRIQRGRAGLRRRERLAAWVFQVTRNVVADYYRAPARRRERPAGLAEDLPLARQPAAARPMDADPARARRELAGCLRPMVDRLPPGYRDAIALVELEGLTQAEAARRLRVPLSSLKSRVQRGRRRLRGMLTDCCRIALDARGGVTDYSRRGPSSCPKPGGCVPPLPWRVR